MSAFSLWLLVSIKHKCQAACSHFRPCLWKWTAKSGSTQTRLFPSHTILMRYKHLTKVSPLCRAPLKASESFLSAPFVFFLPFHLSFFFFVNINMSLCSLSSAVSSESFLMFGASFEGITNKITASVAFSIYFYLSLGEFPEVLFNWLKVKAFVSFLSLTDHRAYPTCLEVRNQSLCEQH